MKNLKVPRWYQDLSIPQMKLIFTLGDILKRDHEERITARTQKILQDIGITSTFVEISPKDIKNLRVLCNLDPVKFLCEVYRFITGNSLEEENYKKFYDCNERIVLSSIAHLTLPETIVELHRRLPMGKQLKLPPKPLSPKATFPKKSADSPYLEFPTEPPDWRRYRNELAKWKEIRKTIVPPRAILPPPCLIQLSPVEPEVSEDFKSNVSSEGVQIEKPGKNRKNIIKKDEHSIRSDKTGKTIPSAATLKTITSVTTSKISKPNPSESEITENPEPEGSDEACEDEFCNVPLCICQEDQHEDAINTYITDLPKKTYPPGRHNLSQKWQDWLLDVDEEFTGLERQANAILKSVRETTKKIFNPDVCDDCCLCRQIKASGAESKEEKHPNLIIDNVTMDETGKRYVVGSLGLTSPPEAISESSLCKPLIIPSEDTIIKRPVIESIAVNEKGQPLYHTAGISKQTHRIPQKIIPKPPLPRKNVPPCNCHEDEDSDEDVPCTYDGDDCTAKKFRKKESSSCRKCGDYSGNKIFRDFERKFRERENKERDKKKDRCLPSESEEKVQPTEAPADKPVNPEKCQKCSAYPEKCQTNPFKAVLDKIAKEKEDAAGKKKVSKKSGIKEYRENLRFALSGVANANDLNKQVLLSGVTVHTPITITPESSESEASVGSMSKHHHWSVTKFTPKSPPKDVRKIMKQCPITKATKRTNNKIVDDKIDQLFNQLKSVSVIEGTVANTEEKSAKEIKETESIKMEINEKPMTITDEEKECKKSEEERHSRSYDKKGKAEERDKQGKQEENDKKSKQGEMSSRKDLSQLMKEALREMAEEGYLLAKLPQCHKIPPLQTWIMYRRGFKLTEKMKKDLLQESLHAWESCETKLYKKIKAPPINMSELKKAALTYGQINKIKRQIEKKKRKFYSTVRKSRVLQSRAMWNLMEYGRYPSVNFKKSYFMYEASKEADGYLLKPYGYQSAT